MMQVPDSKTVSIQDLAPFVEKKILAGGSVELTVPGNSMRPTLLDRVSKVRLTAISSTGVITAPLCCIAS